MTPGYNHADTVEYVDKQEGCGGLYVALQEEFRDGCQPVQISEEDISVLFMIEKQKPAIHHIIGHNKRTDEIFLCEIIRLVRELEFCASEQMERTCGVGDWLSVDKPHPTFDGAEILLGVAFPNRSNDQLLAVGAIHGSLQNIDCPEFQAGFQDLADDRIGLVFLHGFASHTL